MSEFKCRAVGKLDNKNDVMFKVHTIYQGLEARHTFLSTDAGPMIQKKKMSITFSSSAAIETIYATVGSSPL